MADFTALKNSIRNYIKQNGNAEITGEVLQNILISMVVSMGDGAINGIADGLANEGNARTNADALLQNAINSISAELGDGYTYAGIATSGTTPISGRVFYLALQAGTYTNFGGLVVTQGVNILKNNNGTWQLDNVIGIDDVPTAGSPKLVKSGGVFANIGAFDISDYNKSGSTLATYADLTAALAALPSEYQKGGMSVKFVQSSDNKYVQYRFMLSTFTTAQFTNEANWQGVDNEPKFESENLINSGSVFNVSKKLDDNLSTADRISLPYVITKGLVPASGEIVYNAVFDAYIFPLKNGDSVKINVTYSDAFGSGRYGITADYPVNGASLMYDGGVSYVKDVNNKTYTASQDCYLIVSVDRGYVSTGGVNVTIANNGLAKQVATIQAELESQINDLDAQVDGILNTDDTLYKDVTKVANLVPSSGSVVTNASFDCYYAQVKNGETVTIGLTYTDGYGGGFYGVTKNVPVNGATLLFDGGVSILKDVKNKSYTATEDCYILVSVERAYVTGSVSISYPNNGLTKRVERLEQEVDKVFIGVGGDFATVKDGLEYAHRHNIDTVIILPGEYDLVEEGIEDYYFYKYNNPNLKEGFYATKKIYGYGAILRCELSEPNSEISPLNHYYGNDQMEIYGLTIIVANCRYCIHDEMWNMAAYGCNYYHDVFKDLTLIHKTAPNETWSAPINIGGGFGEKGDITIENCVMESEDTKNLDYHTKPASTGAQNGNCNVMVKDCVMNKKVTITDSGSVDTFMNTMYVTNCYSGLAINNSSGANTRLIGWNNVVQQ